MQLPQIEEVKFKMVCLLDLANAFLKKDKKKEESFSGPVIAEIVLPKIDLSEIVQQNIIKKSELLTRKLFKF